MATLSTSRRAVLGGAVALGALTSATLSSSATYAAGIDQRFAKLSAMKHDESLSDDEFEQIDDAHNELEETVLAAPCDSWPMARAKLRLALDRINSEGSVWADKGDVRAIEQVLAYLEAN
jgi:hypothetical protein